VVCGHDVEAFDSATGKRLYLWSEHFPLSAGRGAAAAVRTIPYCATAVMLRRSAFPERGFDGRLPVISDWKLVVDCLHPDGAYGHVDGVYARYRRHPRNVTRLSDWGHASRMFAEVLTLFALIEAEYPSLIPECRRARAEHLLSHGKRHWDRGDRRSAWRYFRSALRESPVGISGWLARRAVLGSTSARD
jgi:hypothetical protein